MAHLKKSKFSGGVQLIDRGLNLRWEHAHNHKNHLNASHYQIQKSEVTLKMT